VVTWVPEEESEARGSLRGEAAVKARLAGHVNSWQERPGSWRGLLVLELPWA
jgi:hypothetical protein